MFMFVSSFMPHRDTPHHLKNKRVQHGAIDKSVANILLANAPKQLETTAPMAIAAATATTNIDNNTTSTECNYENKSGHLNDCGKFNIGIVFYLFM